MKWNMKWKLISIMLILLMVGMAVTAQPMEQKGKEKAKKIKEVKEEIKEKYQQAWHKYQEERQKYIQAHQKYKDLRNKVAFEHAKRYLKNGCHFALNWLERFRFYVNNSNINKEKKAELLSKIDEYMADLEEGKAKINNSTTPQELREAAKELRGKWSKIKNDISVMVGEFAAYKLQVIIEKAEKVSLTLEMKIRSLENMGVGVNTTVNTTEHQGILDEYNMHVSKANQSLQDALTLYNQGNWMQGSKELRKTAQELKKAFKEIKHFIIKLRQMERQGRVFFGNETGEVWVHGNGAVKLEGDAIVNVRGNGTLIISPINAVVTVTGFGNVSYNKDTVSYEGNGRAIIRGKDIMVNIIGENITLYAKGSGTLHLSGVGYYRVKELPNRKMVSGEYNESKSVTVTVGRTRVT